MTQNDARRNASKSIVHCQYTRAEWANAAHVHSTVESGNKPFAIVCLLDWLDKLSVSGWSEH